MMSSILLFFSLHMITFSLVVGACTDGDIRLSPNEDSGHLLICDNSTLYQLCSTGFTEDNARAACRQLGYVEGHTLEARDNDLFLLFPEPETKSIHINYSCNGHEDYLTNGGCLNNSVLQKDCQNSDQLVRLKCYKNILSFVSTVANNSKHKQIVISYNSKQNYVDFTLPSSIPIGLTSNLTSGFIYPFGVISLGDTALTDSQLTSIPDINYRTHSFNVIAPFLDISLSLTFKAVIYTVNDTILLSYPFTIVDRFISNSTSETFEAKVLLLVEWQRQYNTDVEFQLIIASDLETTYAIITHECVPGLRFTPVSAYIGYSIYNYSTEVFRYSETPYSHQIGCLNEGAGINYYNLLYRLTGNVESSSHTSSSSSSSNTSNTCREAGLLTGCCQPFRDPTKSCRVTNSLTNSSCYCDSLCYRYGDCCSDVGSNGLDTPCVTVCQNGSVNQDGNTYYLQGPISICENGLQNFIRGSGTNFGTRGVICQQLIDQQINTSYNIVERMTSVPNVYFVNRANVYCVGIENAVQECSKSIVNPVEQDTNVVPINCKIYVSRNDSRCTNGDIRLNERFNDTKDRMQGSRPLEICLNGKWRIVCSTDVGTNEGLLVCTMMGYSLPFIKVDIRNKKESRGITVFNCPRNASSLRDCNLRYGDCSQSIVAYINCNATSNSNNSLISTIELTATTAVVSPSVITGSPISSQSFNVLKVIIGSSVSAMVFVFIVLTVIIIIVLISVRKYKIKFRREIVRHYSRTLSLQSLQLSSHYVRDIHMPFGAQTDNPTMEIQPSMMEAFQSAGLIIDYSCLRVLDKIGQGEFGFVHKAHLLNEEETLSTKVAVKTLKGTYNQEDIDNLLVESLKMKKMNHPNVMSLLGVCLNGGPAPFIVLPYMAGGNLLRYLVKKRETLILQGNEEDAERKTEIKLLSMSLQIAKGMEYITSKNMIHRDLAARNCMIDHEGIVKVSDFGLSKNLYEKTYVRQERGSEIKLPIKWMAIESISDGIFSEKSDVWSFGVTCWEIFNGGKSPYGGIAATTLLNILEEGTRLEKPLNNACSQSTFELLCKCWKGLPEERPTFTGLITSIEDALTSMADYLDFNQFTLQSSPQ